MIDRWDWPAAFVVSGTVTALLGVVWWAVAADRPPGAAQGPPAGSGELPPDLAPQRPADVQQAPGVKLPGALATDALRPRLAIPQPDPLTLARHQLLNRNVLLLTLSYAAVGYLEYLFFFWMNHYFGTILEVPKERSRVYTAVLFLTMAVGMIAGGWISDRLARRFGPWSGRAVVPMAGMTLGAVFLGLGVTAESIGWIVFWLALALAAVGATEAPTWTAAVEAGGGKGGTAAAVVNTGGNLGGFVAPVLTPLVSHAVRDGFGLSDQAGWQWGISLAGVFCLSGAALWWWFDPKRSAP
jgi:sugar phosphate permease